MKLLKLTTIALLMSATVMSVMGMEALNSPRGEQNEMRDIEHLNLLELIQSYKTAVDEASVVSYAEAMTKLLSIRADHIQAELGTFRAEELEIFSNRAYAHPEHFDYTRLNEYMPTRTHPEAAKTNFKNSTFQQEIKDLEKELRDIHTLMSLVEKSQEVRHLLNAETKTVLAHGSEKKFKYASSYADLIKELELKAQAFEKTYGKGSEKYLAGRGFMARDEFFNRRDTSDCPDAQVVGKPITTLMPHFTLELWQHAANSINMRTGRSTNPVTTIRLQGRLWNVFAGKAESTNIPYIMPHMMPPHMMGQEQQEKLVLLPRTNMSSKICAYRFEHTGSTPHQAPHWGAWMKTSYPVIFVPTEDETLEAHDRSHDPVQDQLRQEIEGERLTVADVHNPEESRRAVNEEMAQRLGRRGHNRYMREEKGFLEPSHIRSQTYGRVHVPDYHYGRTYDRMDAIKPAHPATPAEIEKAKMTQDATESLRRRMFEHEQLVGKHNKDIRRAYESERAYEPGRMYNQPRWGRVARSAVPQGEYGNSNK
jgi:hypothetical protein